MVTLTVRVPSRRGLSSCLPGSQPLNVPTTLTGPAGASAGREKVTRVLLPKSLLLLIMKASTARASIGTTVDRVTGDATPPTLCGMHPEPRDELRSATFRDLEIGTLYAILKLRSEVFVVEQ